MNLAQIEQLLAGCEGCMALALADIGAQTVLWSGGPVKPPQERLDALCAAAGTLLGTAGDGPQEAMLIGTEDQCLMLRLPQEPALALLALCRRETDGARFLQQARAQLRAGAAAG